MSFSHRNPSLEGQLCNSAAGSSSPKPRPWGRGVGCSWVLALTQDAGRGMLDLGCWVWNSGFRCWVLDLGCRLGREAVCSWERGC